MVYSHNYFFGNDYKVIMGMGTIFSTKEDLSVSDLKEILKNKLEFSNINLNEVFIDISPPIKITLNEFIEYVNFSSRVEFY